MVLMCGQMDVNMWVLGRKTNCMARAYTHGKMEEVMRGSMWMIRKKALASIHGQMEDVMKDSGQMVNNMVKVNSLIVRARVKEDSGKMEKGSNG